ncbi:MAG: hypothetical protein PGN37_20520 [Mycobacterium kyogaense]|uniref:hypothetical protein n=1 Tax=Mycobacterium kyogaense TaxID=2212479 RepID=UPI002FF76C4A
MNLNATPDDVRNIAEVCKLAAILDDNFGRADDARIAAWAERAHHHNLTRDDLLDALQTYYDTDPKARERPIGIAALIHHARTTKRDRLARQNTDPEPPPDPYSADALSALTPPGPAPGDTPRLTAARQTLHTCCGRTQCGPAIAEYSAALAEARRRQGNHPTTA